MPERKFLEDFEKPEEPAATTPPPEVTPAPEAKQEAAEPASAAPAAPPVEPPAGSPPPSESKDPKEAAYWRALSDEREKRHKLEAEIAYLRGRTENAAPPVDPKKRKQEVENEFLTDPVGFSERMVQTRIEEAIAQDRMARSVAAMEREHGDWVEKRDKFLSFAKEDPGLERTVLSHPDPARFAYEYVKQREKPAATIDLEAERKKIRAEVEATLRKELALSVAGNVPPTLAGASGAGGGGNAPRERDVNDLFADRPF